VRQLSRAAHRRHRQRQRELAILVRAATQFDRDPWAKYLKTYDD
jgi:hypothetical protein